MRSVLFCNETLGLGHLRLSLAVAAELVASGPDATALVVTGSPAFAGLRPPPGVDVAKLPTAPVGRDSRWSAAGRTSAAGLRLATVELHTLRARLQQTIVEQMRPDVVLVDYKPLGRDGDLRAALEALRDRGGCVVALGLWDVDDSPARLREQWTPAPTAEVARLYDLALVYGPHPPDDVRVAALAAAGLPVHVTGLVGAPPARRPAEDLEPGYLLVGAGGGVDGFGLLDAVLAALETRPLTTPVVMVAGPNMSAREVERLHARAAALRVRLEHHRADTAAVLAGARASISMAGYSTTAEILGSGLPALLVPRTFPREEQLNRAQRLAAAGRVAMLRPDALTPEVLRAAIDALLARPTSPRDPLTGAADAARILTAAVERRAADRVGSVKTLKC